LGETVIDEGVSPLNVTTVEAYSTYGTLEYNDQSFISVVPVTITRQAGGTIVVNTTAVGTFEALLPADTYNVSVDYRTTTKIDSKECYVRYTANGTLEVPSTTQNTFTLNRTLDNTTVSGSIVGADGTPVSAVLEFISDSSTSMNLTAASGLGSYLLSVAPGSYNLYMREAGGMGVYFAAVDVTPYAIEVLNITLQPGLRISGITLNGGVAGQATLELSGPANKTIQSSLDGSYEIILPSGDYDLHCTASGVENGITVSYEATTSVNLTSDLNRVISLSKVVSRGIDLQWDSKEKVSLRPGETAAYNVRVVNTGNVPEVIEIEAGSGTWTVEFSQSEVSVDFGYENSQLVTVYLTAPSNAEVDLAGQKITASSSAEPTVSDSVTLTATILPTYSVNLTFYSAEETTGANYTYTLRLENTGNAIDTYVVAITDLEYLSSLGWDAQLRIGTDEYGDNATTTLSPSSTEDIDLRLVPTRENPSPNVQVSIVATSQESPDTQSLLNLEPTMPEIEIPSDGVTVTGQDVSIEQENVPTETIVLAGMCVASFAVLILLALQRGMFRRRRP
jgi:hypothetical protein